MTKRDAVTKIEADDHVRGPEDAKVTVIEYGDYECPHTRAAQPYVDRLLAENPDVRFVFRHFPLSHIHPHAEELASIAESADGDFWKVHAELLSGRIPKEDGAGDPGSVHDRIERDVDGGRAAGVDSTPTFFFGGEKYDGSYDFDMLKDQLLAARRRAQK